MSDMPDFNELTDEQRRKLEDCQTPEELLALAKEEGYELTQEQLDSFAGGDASFGWSCSSLKCNKGSDAIDDSK